MDGRGIAAPGTVVGAVAGPAPDLPVLRLLGPMELVAGNGATLPLGGRKQRAVLALLALRSNATVTTSHLVDGIWGDAVPHSALNTLQSYVSRLRQLGGAALTLESRPGGYLLRGPADLVDVHRFERLVAQGTSMLGSEPEAAAAWLREALALWRGPALADFTGWGFAVPVVARLEEIRLVAVEDLVDVELALGRHREVLSELEALVESHPLRERLWASLMLALYRAGRQADALRAYQRVREVLADQLGIAPGPALQRLERAVLHQAADLDVVRPGGGAVPVAGPGPGRTGAGSPPLVGRNREMELLGRWLRDADRRRGSLVVVTGEAGIGKTALARYAVSCAAAAGARTAWGRAWEEDGAPPFWPWIEALRDLGTDGRPAGAGHGTATPHLVDVLRGPLGDAGAPSEPAPARFRLFEAVTDLLLEQAVDRPLLVVLEDLHGADDASLLLLRFVARRLAGSRVLLLATSRPPETSSSRLGPLLGELAREPAARGLTLAPLDDDDVARFLRLRLGDDLEPALVAAVQRWAEGHPFFLTELVELLRGRARGRDGVPPHHLEVPQGVRHVIARRLATVSDEAARVLTVASVLGRELPLRLLAEVVGLRPQAVADALDHAAAAHLVEELPAPAVGYRFRHALVREALYEGLSPGRRAALHERVADALEAGAAGRAEDQATEVAHHRCASVATGGAGRAVAALRRAARRCDANLAYEEAVRLSAAALEVLDVHGDDDGVRGELLCELGEAQQRAGDVTGARTSFLAAADVARAAGDADLLARAAIGLALGFEARMSDPQLVRLLEEALGRLDDAAVGARALLLARLSMAVYLDDAAGRREALSDEALVAARRSGDPAVVATALGARYFSLWGSTHGDERLATATEMLRLAEEVGHPDMALDGSTWMAMELLERGDRAGFDRTAARHARLAEDRRHPLHRYQAVLWRAMATALDGRLEEAVEVALHAAALGEPLTELAVPRRTVLLLAVRREQGRLAEVVDDVERVVASYPLLRSSWEPGRALVLLDLGDDGPARRQLDDLLVADLSAPRDANWLSSLVFLTEACAVVGTPAHAEVLYRQLLPHAARCATVRFAPACWGAVSRYLGLLACVRGDLTQAATHLRDAVVRNEHLGAPTWAARARLDLAEVLLEGGASGDRAEAEALRAQAAAAARRLRMARLEARATPG